MGKFDNLSSDRFWDLVYATAKNRKKKKALWRDILGPDYADVVRDLSEAHIERIEREINSLVHQGASKSDEEVKRKTKALEFIKQIRGQAVHAIEDEVAKGRNIRKYEKIQDLIEYAEYLKDTIEDLRDFVPEPVMDFELHTTVESFVSEGEQSNLDDWLQARVARREESGK